VNWLVYHIVSGHAFFTGVVLIVVAAVASARSNPLAKSTTVLAFLVGLIAIIISSTPLPIWCYAVCVVITAAWLASRYVKTWRVWSRYALVAVWTAAAVFEAFFHIDPALTPVASRSMTIIGDSVTAGLGGPDRIVTWPAMLAQQHAVEIQDFSHPGETTASALKRLQGLSVRSTVVVLEIGGNDLLRSTPAAQFARDLDGLLARVSAPGRQVVILELPLPPFSHRFGRIQRSLARKHGAALAPKHVFLSVLAADGATTDSIHLSQVGHERMAASIWRIVRSAYPPDAPPAEGDQP
jgi:acyl-CoA thioesterase-1